MGPLVTVLISSIVYLRFEGAVEHDPEFSHCGSESNFGGFPGGPQSQKKAAQSWVVTRRDQCGHIQAVTHGPATAIDRTFTAHFPTVAIKWCHSDQRRNFTAVVVGQLPHLCPQERCRARTHSRGGRSVLCVW